MCMSYLFSDFNVDGSSHCKNIRISHRLTLRSCVENLDADSLHQTNVLHRSVIHFDCM